MCLPDDMISKCMFSLHSLVVMYREWWFALHIILTFYALLKERQIMMTEPNFLFTVDRVGGRVRERFASPLNPIFSIKMERTTPKPPTRVEGPRLCSSTRETRMVVEVNVRDRAVILMHLNPELDARRAYYMALDDEYNYYHQLNNKDRLLYRSGQLDDYIEIDHSISGDETMHVGIA